MSLLPLIESETVDRQSCADDSMKTGEPSMPLQGQWTGTCRESLSLPEPDHNPGVWTQSLQNWTPPEDCHLTTAASVGMCRGCTTYGFCTFTKSSIAVETSYVLAKSELK